MTPESNPNSEDSYERIKQDAMKIVGNHNAFKDLVNSKYPQDVLILTNRVLDLAEKEPNGFFGKRKPEILALEKRAKEVASREIQKQIDERGRKEETPKIKGFLYPHIEEKTEESKLERKFDTKLVVEEINKKIAEEEAKNGVPFSPEQKNALALGIFLKAKEDFQKETIESSGKLKRAYLKTEKWWSEDLEKTDWKKAMKTAMSAALIGASVIVGSSLLGTPPSMFGVAYRLTTRIAGATGLSMAATAGLPEKTVNYFKKKFGKEKGEDKKGKEGTANAEEEKESLLKKIFTLQNAAMVGSVGLSFALSGGTVAGIAATGIAVRKLSGYILDKKIKAREQEMKDLSGRIKDDYNPEILANNLGKIGEDYEQMVKSLKWLKRTKGIINGAATIGAGIATMTVLTHNAEIKAEANHETQLKHDTELKHEAEIKHQEELKAKITEQIKIKDATVHQGQGITQAFATQMRANPELAHKLGFTGDLDNPKDMAHFTRELAIKTGFMDKGGHEVRVAQVDKVAFELKMENGHAVVEEKTVGGETLGIHHEGDKFGEEINKYEYRHENNRGLNSAETKIHNETSAGQTPKESDLKIVPPHDILHNETSHSEGEHQDISDVKHSVTTEKTTGGTTTREFTSGTVKMTPEIQDQIHALSRHLEAKDIDAQTFHEELVRMNGGRPLSQSDELLAKSIIGSPNVALAGSKLEMLVQQMMLEKQVGHNVAGQVLENPTVIEPFSNNPFGLSKELLTQVKDTHTNTINHLIHTDSSNNSDMTKIIQTGSAMEMMQQDPDVGDVYRPLWGYEHKLHELTGLEPRGETLLQKAETNEEFIYRAEMKAAEMGILDKVKLHNMEVLNHVENARADQQPLVHEDEISKKIYIPVTEGHKNMYLNDINVKFTYNKDGSLDHYYMNSQSLGSGEEILKNNITDITMKYNNEHLNESDPLGGYKYRENVVAEASSILDRIRVYEHLKGNPEYLRESELIKNHAMKQLNDISKFGVIDNDKLPEEFRSYDALGEVKPHDTDIITHTNAPLHSNQPVAPLEEHKEVPAEKQGEVKVQHENKPEVEREKTLQKEVEEKKAEMKAKLDENKHLKEEAEKLKGEHKDLSKKIEQAKAKVKNLTGEKEKGVEKNNLNDKKAEVKAKSAEIENKKEEIKAKSKEIEKVKTEMQERLKKAKEEYDATMAKIERDNLARHANANANVEN